MKEGTNLEPGFRRLWAASPLSLRAGGGLGGALQDCVFPVLVVLELNFLSRSHSPSSVASASPSIYPDQRNTLALAHVRESRPQGPAAVRSVAATR